ncbi:hypothetical protein M378DRAFT_19273 [Amanita muscaria Koide BX008]|uniref:Uncharacterized protein n=1 Tax=Amanita muscaria (strain Koide BX008) TaxID=946122 RepID=A0A0C2WDD9_AMAMK|nr:hypothetical protein M378DRAFT_19273 [Amanita muscaria Koide BX008]
MTTTPYISPHPCQISHHHPLFLLPLHLQGSYQNPNHSLAVEAEVDPEAVRACGRQGYGHPAEFSKRPLLEGEGNGADEEEAEQIEAENARKYSRRQLTSNADRYNELEPELGSDGEVVVEPEVDLSTFLQKQKLSDDTQGPSSALFSKEDMDNVDDDDIDHSIAPLVASNATAQKKGKVTQIEWTPELDAIHREKVAGDAHRGSVASEFLEPVDLTGLLKLSALLGEIIRFEDEERSVILVAKIKPPGD